LGHPKEYIHENIGCHFVILAGRMKTVDSRLSTLKKGKGIQILLDIGKKEQLQYLRIF